MCALTLLYRQTSHVTPCALCFGSCMLCFRQTQVQSFEGPVLVAHPYCFRMRCADQAPPFLHFLAQGEVAAAMHCFRAMRLVAEPVDWQQALGTWSALQSALFSALGAYVRSLDGFVAAMQRVGLHGVCVRMRVVRAS